MSHEVYDNVTVGLYSLCTASRQETEIKENGIISTRLHNK
jgi:hypothetical protein